jgi:hypothetical protein
LVRALHDEGVPGRGLRPWGRFLVNTATVIATVDAALAAAIAVLAVRKAAAAAAVAVAVGAAAFLVVWTALFLLQRQSLSALRRSKPRFPTPPDESLSVSTPGAALSAVNWRLEPADQMSAWPLIPRLAVAVYCIPVTGEGDGRPLPSHVSCGR